MSAWRKNALLLFIISTTRFPLIPRPLYVDSWIKKKMPKIIDHLWDYSFVLLEKHGNSQQSFIFDENASLVNKTNYFQKLPFSAKKRKNKKIPLRKMVNLLSVYNKNAIPYRRFSEWKNAHYSDNMHFYNHFVVNNVSRTTYKAAVFWRKNSNLEKKREILQTIQNRILLQFFSKIKSCKLL